MADQALALRLANALEDDLSELGVWGQDIADSAAAELRRLHAENERLHQINQSHEMKLSVRGYEIQIEDLRLAHAELRKVNGELLEALQACESRLTHLAQNSVSVVAELKQARAAIARAEGETA